MKKVCMVCEGVFAQGYVDELAIGLKNQIVYARICGDADLVRSFGKGLGGVSPLFVQVDDGHYVGMPSDKGNHLFNRVGDTGVLTFASLNVFGSKGDSSVILGKSKAKLRANFNRILKSKNIICDPNWDVYGITQALGFVQQLETTGDISAVHVSWDPAIETRLSELVKEGVLTF
jgi:hypothetical protein